MQIVGVKGQRTERVQQLSYLHLGLSQTKHTIGHNSWVDHQAVYVVK